MVTGVSIDTRSLKPGDLFVALAGDKADGHLYVKNALEQGAAAALVSRSWAGAADVPGSLLVADDPLMALQRWAAAERAASSYKLVALTGSSGKTTTKEMIYTVLSRKYRAARTEGNLNNHIGVPLTILRFGPSIDVGITEMGANHPGEIDQLTRIAQPDVALISNVGYAHIGLFGNLENTADAKFEIVNGIRRGGALFLNQDDPLLVARAQRAPCPVRFFSCQNSSADIAARDLRLDADARVSFAVNGVAFRLQVPGIHMAANALAAIGIGLFLGVDLKAIRDALADFRQPEGRWTQKTVVGITLINDAYNANPSSMQAALATLGRMRIAGRRMAVLGDMLELGSYSESLHREIGGEAAKAGIDELCFFGQFAGVLLEGALKAGAAPQHCRIFAARGEIADYLKSRLKPDDAVLFKGSHSTRLYETAGDLERALTN